MDITNFHYQDYIIVTRSEVVITFDFIGIVILKTIESVNLRKNKK